MPDEEARDRDVSTLAALRRISAEEDPAVDSATQDDPEQVHRLAAAGRWYDAFDRVNAWLEVAPNETRLIEYRNALLAQVGLNDVEGDSAK